MSLQGLFFFFFAYRSALLITKRRVNIDKESDRSLHAHLFGISTYPWSSWKFKLSFFGETVSEKPSCRTTFDRREKKSTYSSFLNDISREFVAQRTDSTISPRRSVLFHVSSFSSIYPWWRDDLVDMFKFKIGKRERERSQRHFALENFIPLKGTVIEWTLPVRHHLCSLFALNVFLIGHRDDQWKAARDDQTDGRTKINARESRSRREGERRVRLTNLFDQPSVSVIMQQTESNL